MLSELLYSTMREALEKNPLVCDFLKKPNPTGLRVRFSYYVVKVARFGLGAGILLGEVTHNLRASLDHLAWIIVRRNAKQCLKARQARSVSFPLTKSRQNFWKNVDRYLPGVPHDQRELIELYQPYRRSPRGRAMRNLRTLSDTDKHRIIIPALVFPRGGELKFKYEGGRRVGGPRWMVRPGQELNRGTELARLVLSRQRGMETRVQVNGTIQTFPGFRRSIICASDGSALSVMDTIEAIKEQSAQILREFEVLY